MLQSGFNAEYGRNSGMVIAVQTKSGANKFHGTLYEYLRNNYFDAKCVQCNGPAPQLRYNQFGGNFSGWSRYRSFRRRRTRSCSSSTTAR